MRKTKKKCTWISIIYVHFQKNGGRRKGSKTRKRKEFSYFFRNFRNLLDKGSVRWYAYRRKMYMDYANPCTFFLVYLTWKNRSFGRFFALLWTVFGLGRPLSSFRGVAEESRSKIRHVERRRSRSRPERGFYYLSKLGTSRRRSKHRLSLLKDF